MVSVSGNVANIQQKFFNQTQQFTSEFCVANNQQTVEGNVVFLQGVTVLGDVTGIDVNGVSMDATCSIVSSMDSSTTSVLQSVLNQTATSETDWFNGGQITDTTDQINAQQTVVNNVTQINQAVCVANATQSVSNNYYIVTDNGFVGGDLVAINVGQSNVNSDCSMNNYMKNVTYNQAQVDADQTTKVKGMLVSIIGFIFGIIALIIIGVIVLFVIGAIGYTGVKVAERPKTQQAPTQTAQQEQIKQLEELLLLSS